MSKIFLKQSPKEVNDLLLNKWGISLFKFAQVFAVSPMDSFLQKNRAITFREIKELKETLKNMRKDILKKTRHIDTVLSGESITDSDLKKDKVISNFLFGYIRMREFSIALLEIFGEVGKRGTGLNKKSIIALGWGNLIFRAGRPIDWQELGRLYFWLWEKIKDYDAYREWTPTDGIEDYLKVQYHRYRFVGSVEDYAIDHSLIPESLDKDEDLVSWLKLILMNSTNGKIPDREITRVVRNITTDWLLADSEGLTIFSPSGSFADQAFVYIYSLLRDKVNKKLLPPPFKLSPLFEGLSEDLKALPRGETEIDDYFLYAANIYLDKKADLKKLPPMIIFPDRTYFCPGL